MMQQIPALAQARTLATGRNDDKESFLFLMRIPNGHSYR